MGSRARDQFDSSRARIIGCGGQINFCFGLRIAPVSPKKNHLPSCTAVLGLPCIEIVLFSDRQSREPCYRRLLPVSMHVDFREHPAYSKLYPAPVAGEPAAFFPQKISREDAAHLDALE